MTSILGSGHDFILIPSDSTAPLPTKNKAPATPNNEIGWLTPEVSFWLFTGELLDQLRSLPKVCARKEQALWSRYGLVYLVNVVLFRKLTKETRIGTSVSSASPLTFCGLPRIISRRSNLQTIVHTRRRSRALANEAMAYVDWSIRIVQPGSSRPGPGFSPSLTAAENSDKIGLVMNRSDKDVGVRR